ncbi:hypothetical protein V5799_006623, partial [Amblyomma americanum]
MPWKEDRALSDNFSKEKPLPLPACDPEIEASASSSGEIEDSAPASRGNADISPSPDIPAELQALRKEIGVQANTLDAARKQPLSTASIRGEKDLNILTGIPCFQLFYNICDVYTDSRMLVQAKRFCLSNEDTLLSTLIKLHHNKSFALLGVLYGIHRTTASEIFKASVIILAEIMKNAVFCPSKEAVVDNLTVYFKEYSSVRAVLDCTEVPIQRPKDMESQLLTYSWYKGVYTAKVLVGETSGGHISY